MAQIQPPNCDLRIQRNLKYLHSSTNKYKERRDTKRLVGRNVRGNWYLPTFTSCCFFTLGTVSNSTASSGFCNQERMWSVFLVIIYLVNSTSLSAKFTWTWETNTYKLVYAWMHPSSSYGFNGSNGFQTTCCTKAVSYHGLQMEHQIRMGNVSIQGRKKNIGG